MLVLNAEEMTGTVGGVDFGFASDVSCVDGVRSSSGVSPSFDGEGGEDGSA